jgi:signal transduction histidine kinase
VRSNWTRAALTGESPLPSLVGRISGWSRGWAPGWARQPGFAHAARVAVAAAVLMAALYVAVVVTFDVVDSAHLVGSLDAQLADRIHDVARFEAHSTGEGLVLPYSKAPSGSRPLPSDKEVDSDGDSDIDGPPVLIWQVGDTGKAVALSTSAPGLPVIDWANVAGPITVRLGTENFRLLATRSSNGWVVAGESLADTERVIAVVDRAELVAGPVLVVAMFLAALAIGVMASRPVEQARRRQLDFTADASHELRTPLTVIQAEVGLALSATRDSAAYREALARIGTEGKRLRHIVEELLFLARFDSTPPPPGDEPVDLAALAGSCAGRFAPVAAGNGVNLVVETDGAGPALVKAPPAWLDRLCGVLIDNACRYAGRGGSVLVTVTARSGTVSLSIDDTGPGIPEEARPRLFDRFYRAAQVPEDSNSGAGLGLAIADAVVRSTGGKWRVGDAPSGGAHMEVSWRRAGAFRQAPSGRREDPLDSGEHAGRSGGARKSSAAPKGGRS